jgi:cyclic pyranopterin phosphate synthase
VGVTATAEAFDATGVEMEALTACTVAGLAIYDMCREADPAMEIDEVAVWRKSGGRSGSWSRQADGSVVNQR